MNFIRSLLQVRKLVEILIYMRSIILIIERCKPISFLSRIPFAVSGKMQRVHKCKHRCTLGTYPKNRDKYIRYCVNIKIPKCHAGGSK